MKKVRLSAINQYRNRIDVLRVLSFDDIYLVEMDVAGETIQVVGDDNAPTSWRSQIAAKKPFKGLGITKTMLRHQSSYDEMIRLGGSAEPMEVGIQNPDADPS